MSQWLEKKSKVAAFYCVSSLNFALSKSFPSASKSSLQLLEAYNQNPPQKEKKEGWFNNLTDTLFNSWVKLNRCMSKSLEDVNNDFKRSQEDIEMQLASKYAYDTNHWVFSRENVQDLENITRLLHQTTSVINHLPWDVKLESLRRFSIIQDIVLFSHPDLLYYGSELDPSKKALKGSPESVNLLQGNLSKILTESQTYSRYATGIYGDFLNYVVSGKSRIKLLKIANKMNEFLKYTETKQEDILFSSWKSRPYSPVYVGVRNAPKKQIILVFRGTLHWADGITDCICHNAKISILREKTTGSLSIRLENPEEEIRNYPKKALMKLVGSTSARIPENYEVIASGHAHLGILLAALEAYEQIIGKLEAEFSHEECKDYELIVTGHSLGGGVATFMTLFLMAPPHYFKTTPLKRKISCYTYGTPPVFSQEFNNFFNTHNISVVNTVFSDDIVSRACLGSFKDLISIIKALAEIKDEHTIQRLQSLEKLRKKKIYSEEDAGLVEFACGMYFVSRNVKGL
eukprot:TRINITY_DN9425_c0_g1_i1.p1 TRINITY_DN9425_c0_g1~~TRINITY_DN9425_c0_g1_i1.p1  ORF type:complete len:516 (-),score=62.27 TRINITY_DN9425_c0_g1_i1:336-1883(-)